MEALSVPFLPAGLWILSVAMTIVLLLVMFGFFIYQHNRKEALLKDGRDVAHLAAKRDLLEAQKDELVQWMQDQKAELERLSAEREEQERLRGELDRLGQECAAKDDENQTLRNEVGALENQKHLLAQTLEKIEQDKEKCSDEVQKLEARKHEVENDLSKSDLMMSEKKEEVEQLKGQVESHQNTMTELEKGIREQKTELGDIEYRHNSLLEKVEKLQDMEHQFDLMKKQLIETKQELDDTEHKLEHTKDQLAEVKQEFKDTKDELAIQERILKETALKAQEYLLEVDRLKSEEIALNSSIKSLEVLAKRLNKQLDGQEGDATAHENKYRDLWYPISFPDLSPVAGSPNEKQLLKKTADYIRGQKLYFPERVLYAFHTALKISDISPLVILAGISGTGKSELPRRYAEGMGLHFVILPVQPRWDSPQDLFGFYNYLERRYKATELARAMVQFERYNRDLWPLPEDWNHDRSDRMLLVLLDEMNLARVEYYFSEFLSRLETRRGINQKDEKERAKAEIALEMGSLREGEKPIQLFPGQNILFAGTMNEDETTQALSDKVLDRACVMRFGRPKQIIEQVDEPRTNPSENGLTFDQWNSLLKEEMSPSDRGKVNKWINDLNDAMDGINRPFGHRVAQAIQSYVANYPDWESKRTQYAMADQIEQRIMPKLRGIEIADSDQSLRKIRSVIEQCDDQELLDAFKKGSENQQIFIWKGIDRTE